MMHCEIFWSQTLSCAWRLRPGEFEFWKRQGVRCQKRQQGKSGAYRWPRWRTLEYTRVWILIYLHYAHIKQWMSTQVLDYHLFIDLFPQKEVIVFVQSIHMYANRRFWDGRIFFWCRVFCEMGDFSWIPMVVLETRICLFWCPGLFLRWG